MIGRMIARRIVKRAFILLAVPSSRRGGQGRLTQIKPRPEFLRLLSRRGFKQGLGFGRLALAEQQNPFVQLRFVQSGVQLQRLAVFLDALVVFSQETVRQRQVKVGRKVGGIGLNRPAKGLRGRLVASFIERLHAIRTS